MEIRSSTSLRNQYNEISEYCKNTGEPIFLTKNGDGDLVVMSIEAYNKQQEILKIKEQLLEARLARANGVKGYSIDELDQMLKKLIGD